MLEGFVRVPTNSNELKRAVVFKLYIYVLRRRSAAADLKGIGKLDILVDNYRAVGSAEGNILFGVRFMSRQQSRNPVAVQSVHNIQITVAG